MATEKQKRIREQNLKPFRPGQSGNPKGRPKKADCLTSLLKQEIEQVAPANLLKGLPLGTTKRTGRTWQEWVVIGTLRLAIKGNSAALKEVWERIDGKVRQDVGVHHDNLQEQIEILQEARLRASRHNREEAARAAALSANASQLRSDGDGYRDLA